MAAMQQLAPRGLAPLRPRVSSRRVVKPVASSGKVDITKQGMNSVEEGVVKQNLMGRSRYMGNKEWRDASGRKGKGKGVFQFESKYGANVDGYSPIWTPDLWTESGDSYKLGTKGLIAWAGLVTVLLAVGVNLIISTSSLGN
ncbi:Photosystem II polypeptide, chloroplastic [Tetrabaena socialis]|uniref:Photosystem II polypeptide, chloroplastic n=1 Tax=Tetrabaena socialis TaxID=47790 RepID=A0A2J8A7A2_9CHLO|nr:Photosystem II polypeptide, chloroplastic [Tetrabaena socialis]|eukprot:PNH08387.1 Photosystem II polypeptide, chloroplastic [Tetrabaena socialis]